MNEKDTIDLRHNAQSKSTKLKTQYENELNIHKIVRVMLLPILKSFKQQALYALYLVTKLLIYVSKNVIKFLSEPIQQKNKEPPYN